MRRTWWWCGVGISGLLACGDFEEPSFTTYDPSVPTTVQPSTPTTDPPSSSTTQPGTPTTGSACSSTDQPCEQDADCCDDICLPGGLCGRFADGEPCTTNQECLSNFCNSLGVCGCLGAGVCCKDAPGDCCGSCNENNTCEADENCVGDGAYCGIFFGGTCCPGYYCKFSFFGSFCNESSEPDPPDACKDPDTDTDVDTTTLPDTTTGTTTDTTTGTTDTTTDPLPDLPPPDPVCGDGVLNGAEVCDGQDLGAGQCTDFPGLGGGSLACTADCTLDTSGCCKSAQQPCMTNAECCPGTTCKFDLLMAKNVCK